MKFYYIYLVINRRLTYQDFFVLRVQQSKKGNRSCIFCSNLFNFTINYNDPQHGATPLYNGNISETIWKTANDNVERWYKYEFDALNRITSAVDNTTNQNYSLQSVSYDKNGNIQNLLRKGHTNVGATSFGVMDDLTYSYDTGNKLMKVADAAIIDEFGFKDDAVNTASDTSNDYTYDVNGNMKTNTNRGITNILYNHLNLPTQVTVNGQNINYTYDAAGTRLKKVAGSKTVEYAGDYIYENNALKHFSHPEGYIEPDGNGFRYVYSYKDHLGNLRLNYSDLDGNGTIDPASEILDEKNYYPFGGTHEGYNTAINGVYHPYGFNGKEENDENGIEWLDFGARNYDKWAVRWMNIDPLADKYRDFTPYNYTANNPILYIDPDGEKIIIGNNTKDALTKLAQIAATNKGQQRIDRLVGSAQSYTMRSVFWSKNSGYDDTGKQGRARTVYYPSSTWRFGVDGGDPGSTYILGHELAHAYDHDLGRNMNNIKGRESSAVNMGNYLRSVYGKDDMRTKYSGLGLKFSDNPKSYNRKNEGVKDFTETLSVEAGGNTFLGFSYEKSEGGETATEYIISVKTEDGTFAYRKFDNQKDYAAAAKRINEYQKKQKEKEDEQN